MQLRDLLVVAFATVFLVGCSAGSSEGSSATSSPPTNTAGGCGVGPQKQFDKISANYPMALAFAPDGRLFYAERSGTVRVYQDGRSRDFAKVDTVTTESDGSYSERGLLGIALSPTFSSDHFVYAFYSKTNRTQQEVIRWTDCAGVGSNASPLIELPSGSDCCHKGGRLAFGPDGKLYVTLGEQHQSSAAQDTSDVRGKVLRYNPDGSVPTDNPFGAGNPVWAYGFRNPFGIAFSSTGQLAITNNGPTGDAGSPSTGYDTVILNVARGGGYQWPNCYGYSHPIHQGASCGDGQIGPDWSSEMSTFVPTGAAFIDNTGPGDFAGHLVFCTDNKGMLVVTPGTPRATVKSGPLQCQLDVKQGPDHALYYSDTGHIYRRA
jgi:glucose/arabinose dehydrogenase